MWLEDDHRRHKPAGSTDPHGNGWKLRRQDNPVKGAPAPNSTQELKRINDRGFDTIAKVDGKETITTRRVISPDGKTLTATQTGRNPQGQTIKNVIVADKQ